MSSRKQLYQEADFTSEDDDRKNDFFTTNRCVLLLLVAATIITLLSWQIWQSYKHIRTSETQLVQINNIHISAMYRDEMLTMSAMLAAVTKNSNWEID